ncbi:MAG: DNA polymerase III subunit beta, partial [Spirochaetaceae bacterium]|nr:DNA polymerase III subunit beta [Spirochaetaceae bacterium]
MKFTFDRDVLLREILIAQEVIATKNALSILSNVMFTAENGTLTIRATDLKIQFETRIPVEIIESGTTTIYCDKFQSILTALPPREIEFNQKDITIS